MPRDDSNYNLSRSFRLRFAAAGGGALLWVLVVLATGLGAVVFFMERQKAPFAFLARESRHRQAFYLAEAGVALQLHRELFFDTARGTGDRSPALQALDTIRFFLDTAFAPPQVDVNRERAFLEIRSTAAFREESVAVLARFGRALDPNMFGAALTLANDASMLPFRPGQIRGAIRLKGPSEEIASLPWPANFPGVSYGDAFITSKHSALEGQLQKVLSADKPETGNGNYTSTLPPRFDIRTEIGHPLGEVSLRHDGGDFWELRGPGVIVAHGDIRVRGRIRLKDITLLTQQDLFMEGEAEAENVTLFAVRHLTVQDQARVEGLLLAGGDLFIRDKAQVVGQSLVIRSGGNSEDSSLALRIVNEAQVSGFVVATGVRGRIVIGSSRNKITGVLMAPEIWPAGTLHGSMVASRLRCGDRDAGLNCLGDAVIDREALPDDFVQPWDFGPLDDRSQIRFKLLSWEVY